MPTRIAPLGEEQSETAPMISNSNPGKPGIGIAALDVRPMRHSWQDEDLPLRIPAQGACPSTGLSTFSSDKNENVEQDGGDEHIGMNELGVLQKDSSKLRGKSFMLQLDKEKAIYKNIEEQTQHMYSSPGRVLDPRKKFMQRWDLVIAVLLAFTALVTPFEVAYITTRSPLEPLFIINRIVDLGFLIDMCFQFNLMYLDDKNMWITDQWKIAKRYLFGSFFIDFISILPFDVVGLVMGDGSISKLKILRILRLMRLFKLLRILRSGRVFRRLEDLLKMGYAMMTLLKFIFGTLIIAHWMACAWMMVQALEGSCTNWIVTYFPAIEDINGEEISFCDPVPLPECEELSVQINDCSDLSAGEDCVPGCGYYYTVQTPGDFLGISIFHLYVTSFYWSLVTMSTIGYGDVLPNTLVERVFAIMAMIFGTSVFAYVVGSVCGIVQNLDKRSTEFYELMDNLSSFAQENRISENLNVRLRAYFRYRAQYTSINEWGDLMRLMSPALRGEVAMLKCGEWVQSVPYFRTAPQEFIVDISMRLITKTFPQSEQIISKMDFPEEMYIVERGIVGCKGRVVVRGKVLGAELMLTNYPAGYVARALTYTDLFALQRGDLNAAVTKFPDVGIALRKASCKEICRRQTLAFTRMWMEMTSAGQLAESGAMSRSSFRSMQYNPAERGRRVREMYLRDTAVQLLKASQKANTKGPEANSKIRQKRLTLVPAFVPMTSSEFKHLLQDEEIRATKEDAEPASIDGKQDFKCLMENQNIMMNEIASLSRTVHRLSSTLYNMKWDGGASSVSDSHPSSPKRVSEPAMPTFHDCLDSRRQSLSSNAPSKNMSRAGSDMVLTTPLTHPKRNTLERISNGLGLPEPEDVRPPQVHFAQGPSVKFDAAVAGSSSEGSLPEAAPAQDMADAESSQPPNPEIEQVQAPTGDEQSGDASGGLPGPDDET